MLLSPKLVEFIKLPKVVTSVGISLVRGLKVDVKREIIGTNRVVVVGRSVVVSISSGFFGTNGYCKHGKAIGGPEEEVV